MGINYLQIKVKGHMQYCVQYSEERSKLANVKAQVSELKGVMMEIIEKVHMCLVGSIFFNVWKRTHYVLDHMIMTSNCMSLLSLKLL